METLAWTYMDKTARWGQGPWSDEPDKIQWQDEATGLPCLVVRSYMGAWCGYVGVSEGHPAFRKGFGSVGVSVHGGLTFSDVCQVDGQGEEHQASSVCHLPGPGEPDHVWWLGFDCGHYRDIIPELVYSEHAQAANARLHKELPKLFPAPPRNWQEEDSVYRDVAYVQSAVRDLARQLAEMGRAKEAPRPGRGRGRRPRS